MASNPDKPCPIGGLDPRARLLAAAGMALLVSALRGLPAAGLALAAALALVAIRRPPAPALLRQMAAANVFVVFMCLTVPATVPGTPLAGLGPVQWSREGAWLALLIAVKGNAILLSSAALVSGIGLPLIGCALERLRVPAKLVFLFMFASRYISVIGGEWKRLQTAAKLRGFAPRNSLHTYRTIGNMLGLTFINAIDRSHRVYEAMLLRGFRGTFHTATEIASRPRDYIFVSGLYALLGALLAFDMYAATV